MNRTTALSGALLLSGLASTASAQVWSETFDGQSNEGAWEIWWNNYNVIETQGGNPGSYLHFDNLTGSANCQFVEIFPTVWPASFSGDWQTAGVQGLGFDMDVRSGPPNTSFGAITVRVGFDNGTPGNTADDCYIERVSTLLPPSVTGWLPYDFTLDATSATLPNGWTAAGPCGGTPDAIWNQVIQNVSYFRFKVDYDTTFFCAFANWDMGVDNIRVVGPTTIYTPFCPGDGTAGMCPCGNTGTSGEGCANSSGAGALLAASGSRSVGADDVTFQTTGGPGPVPALLFVGTQQVNGGLGSIFGDGLRCVGGPIQRLGVQIMDAGGAASWGPGLAPLGGWSAGDTRYFQTWYRDVTGTPCGGQFNTSQGIGIAFIP